MDALPHSSSFAVACSSMADRRSFCCAMHWGSVWFAAAGAAQTQNGLLGWAGTVVAIDMLYCGRHDDTRGREKEAAPRPAISRPSVDGERLPDDLMAS